METQTAIRKRLEDSLCNGLITEKSPKSKYGADRGVFHATRWVRKGEKAVFDIFEYLIF